MVPFLQLLNSRLIPGSGFYPLSQPQNPPSPLLQNYVRDVTSLTNCTIPPQLMSWPVNGQWRRCYQVIRNVACKRNYLNLHPSSYARLQSKSMFWYIHLIKLFNVPVEQLKYVEISTTNCILHTQSWYYITGGLFVPQLSRNST